MWTLTVHDIKGTFPLQNISLHISNGRLISSVGHIVPNPVISNPAWLSEPPPLLHKALPVFYALGSQSNGWKGYDCYSQWQESSQQQQRGKHNRCLPFCLSSGPISSTSHLLYLLQHQDNFTEPGWGGMEGLTSDPGENSILVKWPSDHKLETGAHVLKIYTQTSGLSAHVNFP